MAEDPEKKEGKGFTVIDRRGREEEEATEAPPASERSAPASEQTPPTPLPRIDFSTFVLSLSTSALYHLGIVPDPESGEPGPKDLDLARQTIDTLELLQEKTRGNLDTEEGQLLESLLYELRMRFVEASG